MDNLLYYLWLIVLVFAFIGSNVGDIPIGQFHLFPFRLLLVFYWFLFFTVFLKRKGKINSLSKYIIKCFYFFVIWLSWGILSSIWAISKVDAARHIIFLFTGCSIIFFTTYNFNSNKKIKDLYRFLMLTIVTLIGIGIWEILTKNHLPASRVSIKYVQPWYLNRPSGIFANMNDYATFLCLSAPFLYLLAEYTKNLFLKTLNIVLLGIAFFMIVFISSRANIIGVVIEFAAIFILSIKKHKWKSFLLHFLLVFLLSFVAIFILSPSLHIMQTSTSFFQQIVIQMRSVTDATNGSNVVRLNLLKNGMIFLKNSGLMGVGAGNVEWYEANKGIYYVGYLTKANIHNWWAEILIDYGIFIFVFYLVFYFSLLKNLFLVCKNEKQDVLKLFAEGSFVSLIGFSVSCLSSSSIIANRSIWFLFGAMMSVVNVYGARK